MKLLTAISLLFITLLITGCATSSIEQETHTEYQTYVQTGELSPVTLFTDTQGNQINLNSLIDSSSTISFS